MNLVVFPHHNFDVSHRIESCNLTHCNNSGCSAFHGYSAIHGYSPCHAGGIGTLVLVEDIGKLPFCPKNTRPGLGSRCTSPQLGLRRCFLAAMGCGQSGQSTAKENKGSGGQAHDKQQAKEENKQYQVRGVWDMRCGSKWFIDLKVDSVDSLQWDPALSVSCRGQRRACDVCFSSRLAQFLPRCPGRTWTHSMCHDVISSYSNTYIIDKEWKYNEIYIYIYSIMITINTINMLYI